MIDKRKPGQSQLDYLWVTFGSYEVSDRFEDNPSEYIPTQEAIIEYLKKFQGSSKDLFEIVDSLPVLGDSNKIYLVQNEEGYSAYAYVNNLAILIGSVGGDAELQRKVEDLTKRVDEIENNLNWFEY